MAEPQQSSLLALPRELRNHVLDYLLLDHHNAPISPLFPGKRTKGLKDIMFPSKTPNPASRRLAPLLVNKQLHIEFLEHAHLLYTSGHATAELDIMAKGYSLWPTWTRLPTLPLRNKPADLTIHLRVFSTEAFRPLGGGGSRAQGAGLRGLYALINNFIRMGRSLEFYLVNGDQGVPGQGLYVVDRLTVEVEFCDLYTPDTWAGTVREIVEGFGMLAGCGGFGESVGRVRVVSRFTVAGRVNWVEKEWVVRERGGALPWEKGGNAA
ncbi:hypothetical protein LTR62_007804 [Meristemomyces frigidus]|uniref:Uncharacterized protein n=1 Tax=Meristemomyces frigidus TaxID=1508187 RepID=A0AAN7TBJ9_9PEZI|nr:hypothetical protein LTR62_007804 [Meristemomyces frigidus]